MEVGAPRVVDEAVVAREAAVGIELVHRALGRRDHALQQRVVRTEERHLALARLLPSRRPGKVLARRRRRVRLGPGPLGGPHVLGLHPVLRHHPQVGKE
eukprot:5316016-Alexandrium_andersonii.AAC.1